jgi:hypothetical protein
MEQIKTQALAPSVQAFMDRNFPDGWSEKHLLESIPFVPCGDELVYFSYQENEYFALIHTDVAWERVLIMHPAAPLSSELASDIG